MYATTPATRTTRYHTPGPLPAPPPLSLGERACQSSVPAWDRSRPSRQRRSGPASRLLRPATLRIPAPCSMVGPVTRSMTHGPAPGLGGRTPCGDPSGSSVAPVCAGGAAGRSSRTPGGAVAHRVARLICAAGPERGAFRSLDLQRSIDCSHGPVGQPLGGRAGPPRCSGSQGAWWGIWTLGHLAVGGGGRRRQRARRRPPGADRRGRGPPRPRPRPPGWGGRDALQRSQRFKCSTCVRRRRCWAVLADPWRCCGSQSCSPDMRSLSISAPQALSSSVTQPLSSLVPQPSAPH